MQALFHCKGRFGTMRMHARTLQDLDLYPIVDHKHMKAIDAYYSVRVGYWVLKNNVQEYKVYVTVIQMFDWNFENDLRQALGDNSWLVESTNHNYKTHFLCQA